MGTDILDELEQHLSTAQPPSWMCTCSFREACQKTHNRQQRVSNTFPESIFLYLLIVQDFFSFLKYPVTPLVLPSIWLQVQSTSQITDETLTSFTFL